MDWAAVFAWIQGFGAALGTVVGLGVGGWKFITRARRKAIEELDRREADAAAARKAAEDARAAAEAEARRDRQMAAEATALVRQMLLDEIAELRIELKKKSE